MAAHLLDHFVFSSKKLKPRTKQTVFGVLAFLIIANFWWFRGVSFGIEGPINDHWGLRWRKVRYASLEFSVGVENNHLDFLFRRAGISTTIDQVVENC
jgi:hypothetical protein